jgi:hypothetical protein
MTVTALYTKGTGTVDTNDHSGEISSDKSTSSSGGGSSSSDVSGTSGSDTGSGTTTGTQTTDTGTTTQTTNGTTATANSTGSTGGVSANTVTRNSAAVSDGTKVVVTKSGISNTDLVSAKVSGTSDNFVVKISDSDSARSEVEQALLSAYGSLDNLKYFAMDISLYDSTGTSKIEDTTGISVTITMPLPDALAGYAGNNKAGAVKNSEFEKLDARLLTIDNVPCISFTATHFSPYAIYVETNNLTGTTTIDQTPKTGDPLQPKWFLSIGLALISILLFLGKGSKNKIVKVIE